MSKRADDPCDIGTHERTRTLSIHVLTGRAKRRQPVVELEAPKHSSAELLDLVQSALDDAKAEDVTTIDLTGKSSIADQMVIASGRSQRHVGAIADQLQKRLKTEGRDRVRIEGMPQCDWVLVDAGDVIVHIFQPEAREFYNLEKMWQGERPQESMPS